MQLNGKSAIVTGGASGIGRELCLKLAKHSCRVTVADWSREKAEEVVNEIKAMGKEAQAASVNVADDQALGRAFQQHLDKFQSLDIVCLNAGVLEKGNILSAREGGTWEQTLEINLRAQMAGTRQAALSMQSLGSGGVILFTASAGGIFPMTTAPVYSASKAGLIHFARSVTPRLAKKGIRVCTICPQAVQTPLVNKAKEYYKALLKSFETRHMAITTCQSRGHHIRTVADCGLNLIADDSKNGTVLFLQVTGRTYEYQFSKSSLRRVASSPRPVLHPRPNLASRAAMENWAHGQKPSSVKRVQVYRLSSDFRAATRIVDEALGEPQPGEVLVRRAYAGINASDVNFTAGRYFGSPEQSQKLLPFHAGFESVGVVAALGKDVKELSYGAFSAWGSVPEKLALPVPACAPEIVALLTSGLTASIGLEVAGRMGTDETVLITAAAGGTGQFAVQLAKAAGNHVIATCSSAEKAKLLKTLGADRVINYRQEDVKTVLKQEYPKGINLIWESVGGAMFETCTKALANGGRLIVIGMMSQYGSGWKPSENKGLLELLLQKSASLQGFFLPQHARRFKEHLNHLATLWTQGKLRAEIDTSHFIGVESAADAVEYLQGGSSIGKVVLQLGENIPCRTPKSRL